MILIRSVITGAALTVLFWSFWALFGWSVGSWGGGWPPPFASHEHAATGEVLLLALLFWGLFSGIAFASECDTEIAEASRTAHEARMARLDSMESAPRPAWRAGPSSRG